MLKSILYKNVLNDHFHFTITSLTLKSFFYFFFIKIIIFFFALQYKCAFQACLSSLPLVIWHGGADQRSPQVSSGLRRWFVHLYTPFWVLSVGELKRCQHSSLPGFGVQPVCLLCTLWCVYLIGSDSRNPMHSHFISISKPLQGLKNVLLY